MRVIATWWTSSLQCCITVLDWSDGSPTEGHTRRNKTDAACTSCRAETTERTSALTFNAADEADEVPTRIMAKAKDPIPHTPT